MTICQLDPVISEEPQVRILGSEVHLISTTRTVDYIEHWIECRSKRCRRIVVSGFHGLWEAHKNHELRSMLASADLWVPDGIAPIWVARLRHRIHADRSPGADIMREFFRRAQTKRYRSFFYGDTDTTLSSLETSLKKEYPNHEIAGMFSPPFRTLTQDEDREIIEKINAARPDVLWVGLGLPKQEIWMYERRHLLKVPVVIGIGAALGFVAGTVPRCPEWLGSLGFEWTYRFAKQPTKLWRRDLLDGPRFLFHLALEEISGKVDGRRRIGSRNA